MIGGDEPGVLEEQAGGVDPTLTRKRLSQSYRDLAATPIGEVILAHLYEACAQGKSSVTTGWDPIVIAFREGARSIWLEIEDLLDYSPDADAARLAAGDNVKPKTYKKRPKSGGGKR